MVNFLLLLPGPLGFAWFQKGLEFRQRLINLVLCFGIGLVSYELLFPIGDLEDWIQWGYSLGCSVLAFGLSVWLVQKRPSLKQKVNLFLILISIVYIQRLFYVTMNAQQIQAVRIASGSLASVVDQAAKNLNPPLYFILLKGWCSLFSQAHLSLLLFSLIPFVLLLLVSWKKIAQKNEQWWLLFWCLLCFLPISLSASYYLWGYMASGLFAVLGTLLLFESVQKNSWGHLFGALICLIISGWFHLGGILVACIDSLAFLIYGISQRKWVRSILFMAIEALNAMLILLVIYSHLTKNTAPVDFSEMQSVFLYIGSIFSGWEGGQFPFLFLAIFATALFGYALKGKEKKKIYSYWFYTLAFAAPIAIFLIVKVYMRFIAYWRSVELLNSSFLPMDIICWLGFALLISTFRNRKLFEAVFIVSILIGAFNCNYTIDEEFTGFLDVQNAERLLKPYRDQEYTFLVCDYRGNIGFDTKEVEYLSTWYLPVEETYALEGQNIKNLDFANHPYIIFSNEKLTSGLKRLMQDAGKDWRPLGYITLPVDVDLYVYLFES